MKRRLILLLLVGFLFGSSLAAAAEKTTDLYMYTWWGATQMKSIQKAADTWAAKHPGVVVHIAHLPSTKSGLEGLIVHYMAGVQMDLVSLQPPYLQYAGMLQPLDPFISKGTWAIPQNYPPVVMESFKYQGKIYGFPGLEAQVGSLLFWNKDMFANSGMPEEVPPRTLDELLRFNKKLSRLDSGGALLQYGIDPLDSMLRGYFELVVGAWFNVNWYNPATNELNLMAFEPAVRYIQQLYENPSYDQIKGLKIPTWTGAIASGKQAMQINGSWVVGEIQTLYGNRNLHLGYSWVPTPLGDKATCTAPWGLAIPATSKYPDLAYDLINFFAGPEGAQIMFDGMGWLNLNLKTMPRLDLTVIPDVKNAISMFLEADRIDAPVSMPTIEQIRQALFNELTPVWQGRESASSALEQINGKMKQLLLEVSSRKK